jgi:hypothetical protein
MYTKASCGEQKTYSVSEDYRLLAGPTPLDVHPRLLAGAEIRRIVSSSPGGVHPQVVVRKQKRLVMSPTFDWGFIWLPNLLARKASSRRLFLVDLGSGCLSYSAIS